MSRSDEYDFAQIAEAMVSDPGACWAEVEDLVERLSQEMRIQFKITDDPEGCQDGSALGSIGVYCLLPPNQRQLRGFAIFSVEFSRFGRLFTVESSSIAAKPHGSWSLFSSGEVSAIVEMISAEGFVFVPAEILAEPYTLAEEDYECCGVKTWRERFFSHAL